MVSLIILLIMLVIPLILLLRRTIVQDEEVIKLKYENLLLRARLKSLGGN